MRKNQNPRVYSMIIGISMLILFYVFLNGCAKQPSANISSSAHIAKSYILPVTIDTFDAGEIHNAMLYFIFMHYDTVKYAAYPDKFSEAGFDSLAALFIEDSLHPSMGSYTPAAVAAVESDFDSTFHAGLSTFPSYAQFVAGVDTAEAQGIFASDEASFLISADTDIRLCSSYTQLNDTISSLLSQWGSISWQQTSQSHGVAAYEYLSIAKHSSSFWGHSGDTIAPIAAKPIVDADAEFYPLELAKWQAIFDNGTYPGLTQPEVPIHAEADASAESAAAAIGAQLVPGKGVVQGIVIGTIIYLLYLLGSLIF